MNKSITTYLKYFVIAGIFVIPFLPLIVSPSMLFPYITGKNFYFRILVEIIFSAWLLLALVDAKYRPKFNWIFGVIGIFTLIMFVADVFGMNSYKSFWSNYERMEGWITLIHLALYFVAGSSTMLSIKHWRSWFNVSLGVSIVVAMNALGQLFSALSAHTPIRVDVFLGNSAYLAVYMLIHVFLALYLAMRKDNRVWLRVIYILIAVIDTVILYFTATRGAILGLLGGLFVATVLTAFFVKDRPILKKTAIVGVIVVLVLVAGFFAIRGTSWAKNNFVLNRFASISLNDNTTKSRFMIWNMALQGFVEKPILGWGQEGFNYVFNKYYNPRMYAQEQWFDRTHNVFFDWLIAGGALGLLSYLSIIFFILWYLWKSEDTFTVESKALLTGLIAAHFIHNLFVFDNLVSYVLFFTVAAFVYSLSSKNGQPICKKEFTADTVMTVLAPLVVVVLCVGVYYINIKPMRASATLIDAMNYAGAAQNSQITDPTIQQQYASTSLAKFQEVVSLNTLGTTEMREQLLSIAPRMFAVAGVSQDTKQSFARFAVEQMQEQVKKAPNDARYQLFTGSLLSRFGQPALAIPFLEKARDLSPKKQYILFELGSNYLAVKAYDKALETFKYAYELDKSFDTAASAYYVASIQAGKDTAVCEEIGKDACVKAMSSDTALKTYYDQGKYAKAANLLSSRIQNDPKNLQYRISLVAVYLKMGDNSAAIAELREIKKIDSSSGAQSTTDYYIKEIQAGRNPLK